jgi:hypothetical protein
MSQSQYAQTQDEIAGILGMSRQQFGKYAKQADAPQKLKSGYNVAQWTKFVREVKDRGLTGDGSLKDEKTLREIKRLDIMISKDSGELTDYRETLSEMQRVFQGLRGAIESWRRHQSAKNPGQAEAVDQMADDLLKRMIETVEEFELDKSE